MNDPDGHTRSQAHLALGRLLVMGMTREQLAAAPDRSAWIGFKHQPCCTSVMLHLRKLARTFEKGQARQHAMLMVARMPSSGYTALCTRILKSQIARGLTSARHQVAYKDCDVMCRPLNHLRKAAQIWQSLDNFAVASEAQYLAAMVCDAACLLGQRNSCAASSLHLQNSLIAAL